MAAVVPRDSLSFYSLWDRSHHRSIVALAITLDSGAVGHISCFSMDGLDSVGYWIARDYLGRGIATCALLCPTPFQEVRSASTCACGPSKRRLHPACSSAAASC